MDINQIYNLTNTLANKYLSGAIAPDEFTQIAQNVSIDIFKLRAGLPEDYQIGQWMSRQGYQATFKISDDIKHLITLVDIAKSANNLYPYPANYGAFSSLRAGYIDDSCEEPTLTWQVVEMVTDAELSIRLQSQLMPPTMRRPIGAYYAGGFQVLPQNYTSARLTYLRLPTPPVWNYNVVNDQAIYTPIGSFNFDYPQTMDSDIIIRICRYMGINLRENDLVEYSLQRQNAGT